MMASASARAPGLDRWAGARYARGELTGGLGALELFGGLFLSAAGNGVVLRRVHDGRLS